MAETVETITSAERRQSIARIELFTDAALPPAEWRVVYHFEDGLYVYDVLQGPTTFGTRRVERRFRTIKEDTITAAGVTVTVEQLAALLKAGGYLYRQADINAAAQQQGEGNGNDEG